MIRRLGIEAPDPHHEALQRAHALDRAAQAGLDRLHEVTADAPVPEEILDALRRVAQERAVANWEPTDAGGSHESPPSAYRRVRRDMMAAERAALLRLRDEGEIDDAILRALQRELDLEDALLVEFQQSDSSKPFMNP